MKFAKELNDDLVPEWRVKYFDYKQGKKKIKAISRAVRDAYRSPPTTPFSRARTNVFKSSPLRTRSDGFGTPKSPSNLRTRNDSSSEDEDVDPLNNIHHDRTNGGTIQHDSSPAVPIPAAHDDLSFRRFSKDGMLPTFMDDGPRFTRYGSIIASPPNNQHLSRPATLNLPDPALETDLTGHNSLNGRVSITRSRTNSAPRLSTRNTMPAVLSNAFEVGKTRLPFRPHVSFVSRHMSMAGLKDKSDDSERPLLKRLFSPRRALSKANQLPDVPLAALQQIDEKQDEFFAFLDSEMDKIETFYKSKEQEASERLEALREQLHMMRDQRLDEIIRHEKHKRQRSILGHNGHNGHLQVAFDELNRSKDAILENPLQLGDIPHGVEILYHPIKAARQVHFGKQPRHPNLLATPPSNAAEQNKDYTRRATNPTIPYLTAKRKLKSAMLEFYRGLELLKSFALLNRTALRKINKKYDKAVNARPTMRYMSEKVEHAYFVQSTVLDGHITAVEDLYARYFEKGSHKVAVGKLRRKSRPPAAYTAPVFRNGLFAAGGAVFGIEALVYATELLFNADSTISTETSYLLQLYGGYLLALILFLFFCFDCMIFTQNKVNYVFVFEFDTRHNLDWRQLAELPCFFAFLLGLTMWLNFLQIGGNTMYIYYPVILIGLTALIMFCPFSVLYSLSRKWLLASLGRLWFGAGLFPVEFRDFFLGDMFCSLTYAMGNIEVFFCLYAHYWNNPTQCNSSHSRLLGFFTALPGIWRALQCLRRYRDTKNVFPHLVNCAKYMFTILSQVSLSMYRINRTQRMEAFFITCSAINSIFCSFWDLHMDWSLLDPNAEHPFLRPHLAYERTWPYYLAMVLDPMLRFNWIFFVVFPVELQHSAILSFAVAFTEVCRRGMWTLFRVENEHCTNVGRFRASRDVPLPYKIRNRGGNESSAEELLREHQRDQHEREQQRVAEAGGIVTQADDGGVATAADMAGISAVGGATMADGGRSSTATGVDVERQQREVVQALRRRQPSTAASQSMWHKPGQTIRERIGQVMRRAHAQDFERRKTDDDEDVQHEDSEDDEEEQHEEDEEQVSDAEDLAFDRDELIGRAPAMGQNGGVPRRGQGQGVRDDVLESEVDRQDRRDLRAAEEYLHRARTGENV